MALVIEAWVSGSTWILYLHTLVSIYIS